MGDDIQTYDYLIIGGGMVADAAARGIRERDTAGTIGILSADSDEPYTRPALSKKLWTDPDFTWDQVPLNTVADTGAELCLNTLVTRIDRFSRAVETDDGELVGYRRLLLATGSTPRTIPAPEGDDRILAFRSAEDYRRLRELGRIDRPAMLDRAIALAEFGRAADRFVQVIARHLDRAIQPQTLRHQGGNAAGQGTACAMGMTRMDARAGEQAHAIAGRQKVNDLRAFQMPAFDQHGLGAGARQRGDRLRLQADAGLADRLDVLDEEAAQVEAGKIVDRVHRLRHAGRVIQRDGAGRRQPLAQRLRRPHGQRQVRPGARSRPPFRWRGCECGFDAGL